MTPEEIEASILERVEAEASTTIIEYQPGTGSRYALAIVDMGAMHHGAPSALAGTNAAGCWLVIDITDTKGRAMRVQKIDTFLHWKYVGEKLQCGATDALVIAELLGHLLGRATAS